MNNNNLTQEYKNWILKAIDYHFPTAKIILFGSRARGTNSPGSDVDLALDIGEPIRLAEMGRARVTLENLPIALNVDIVDMHSIPDTLKDIILREGIVWKEGIIMTKKVRFKVDKLVRDKTQERLNRQRVTCPERVMETEEFVQRLKDKLVEEAHEVLEAQTTEEYLHEIADVLEVIHALTLAINLSYEQIEQKRLQIKEERGGFEGRKYHEYAEMEPDNKNVACLRDKPDKYPVIK